MLRFIVNLFRPVYLCEISIQLDNNQNFENDISFSIYSGTRGTNMNTLSISYTNNEWGYSVVRIASLALTLF